MDLTSHNLELPVGATPVSLKIASGEFMDYKNKVGNGVMLTEVLNQLRAMTVRGQKEVPNLAGVAPEPGSQAWAAAAAADQTIRFLCGKSFPLALIGDEALARHVCETSGASGGLGEADLGVVTEFMQSLTTGQAILCEIPLASIRLSPNWEETGAVVSSKEQDYDRMSPASAPPLLLDDHGELLDGYRRYRNAERKGFETVLAYVCVDPDCDLSPLAEMSLDSSIAPARLGLPTNQDTLASKPEDVVTKFTQIITRADGSEVKLVATMFDPIFNPKDVAVDVFRRDNAQANWILCSKEPKPGWRDMPREQYMREGRPEYLRYVSHGEILKVAGAIGRRMSDPYVTGGEAPVRADVRASGEARPAATVDTRRRARP